MGYRWIVYGSHLSHTLFTLSNTFLVFSKLTNLWPNDNLATLRIGTKNECNFRPVKESGPVVFLITLLWYITSWFFAHRNRWDNSLSFTFIFWVRVRKSGGGAQKWRNDTKHVPAEVLQTSCIPLFVTKIIISDFDEYFLISSTNRPLNAVIN